MKKEYFLMLGIAIVFMCCKSDAGKSDHIVNKDSGINGTWLYSSYEVDTMSAKNKDLSAGTLAAAVIMNDSNWRVNKLVIKDTMFVSFKKDGASDTAILKRLNGDYYCDIHNTKDTLMLKPTTDTNLTFKGYGAIIKFARGH